MPQKWYRRSDAEQDAGSLLLQEMVPAQRRWVRSSPGWVDPGGCLDARSAVRRRRRRSPAGHSVLSRQSGHGHGGSFERLTPDAYYERPIPLRHPVVFYDGHIPAFAVNAFLKKGLGHPGVDGDLEVLFARGIDPADGTAASVSAIESLAFARRREPVRGAGRRRHPDGACVRRRRGRRERGAAPRPGRLHDPRARGDAPGDAALHVAPSRCPVQAPARGVRAGRGDRTMPGAARDPGHDPGRPCHARRRDRGDPVRLGQRVSVSPSSRSRRSRSTSTT